MVWFITIMNLEFSPLPWTLFAARKIGAEIFCTGAFGKTIPGSHSPFYRIYDLTHTAPRKPYTARNLGGINTIHKKVIHINIS